jgi:hypothetical protein
MKSENDVLDIIKKRFPRQDHRVNQLYEENSSFRALCADYFYSLSNLHKFRELSELEEKSIEDYENVLKELEKELYDFLFP